LPVTDRLLRVRIDKRGVGNEEALVVTQSPQYPDILSYRLQALLLIEAGVFVFAAPWSRPMHSALAFAKSLEPEASEEPREEQRSLGQMLIEDGIVSSEDLHRALAFQKSYGGRLGGILLRFGALSEDRLLATLSRQLGIPLLRADAFPSDPALFLSAIEQSGYPVEWWIDQEALPWFDGGERLHCVARDPLATALREFLAAAFAERPLCWYLTANQSLDRALDAVQRAVQTSATGTVDDVSHLRELAEEAPVVELVQNLLSQAFNERASDIHVEPEERSFHARFRIDGVLQNRLTLPRERFDAVASRVKLISGMDIAERRLPQDGRLTVRIGGEDVDVRVASLPGSWGESLVLRLLPKRRTNFRLGALGMASDDLERYRAAAREPHGITLVTGPTGSGKSTTLYATLEEINDGSCKIVTVEEPIEYNIPGITQVHAQAEIGYTFARALRAILRQDPDKIMIGEIRDLETAGIAVQAALTGHMVFSTLHTNDAASSFSCARRSRMQHGRWSRAIGSRAISAVLWSIPRCWLRRVSVLWDSSSLSWCRGSRRCSRIAPRPCRGSRERSWAPARSSTSTCR